MQVVELKSAYHWHCENCAAENFALPAKAELTDEEAEYAYRRFHDLEDFAPLPDGWREFEMVQVPSKVVCSQCQTQFRTIDEQLA